MTIFVDPYSTTMGAIHDMKRISMKLEESVVRDPETFPQTSLGVVTENGVIPSFITGCRDSEWEIQSFTHPISIKNFKGHSYLFTDVRPFIKKDAQLDRIGEYIRRQEEFDFTRFRAIASLAWVAGDVTRFRFGMRFATDVFANWIGQTVAKTLGLDAVEQTKLYIIAGAFYESLHVPHIVDYSEDDESRISVAQYLGTAFKQSPSSVSELLKTFSPMGTIDDMCTQITKTIQSVRVENFNTAVLMNLIANTWFATNSKAILAVSVEHPPTFASIVYFCAMYNNFKKSLLGQTIISAGRGGKTERFCASYGSLISDYTSERGELTSVMEALDPNSEKQVEIEVPEFDDSGL